MDSIFMMKSKVGGSYSIIESKEEPNYKTLVLRIFSYLFVILFIFRTCFFFLMVHIFIWLSLGLKVVLKLL